MRKLSVTLVVITLVSIGFGNIVSETARAAFIDPLSGTGLSASFTPKAVEWNSAGTMAIVTGHDSASGPNTYIYWPMNDTYYPLAGGSGFQYMYDVDYFSERVPPSVLVVDADYYNTLAPAYMNALSSCKADVTVWDVFAGAAPANKPKSGDMAGYDVVIWIPSRDMWGGILYDAFSFKDEAEVGLYLDGGGNFMLSNIHYTDYTSGGGVYAPGNFPYDYLGVNSIINSNSVYDDYVNNTVGDLAFGGLGQSWLNWNQYGWTASTNANDEIYPGTGEICFWGTDSTLTNYAPMGIRYDSGTFKSVFFGFPFEVLGSTDYMNGTMRKALEWFVPNSQTRQASVLLVDADYYGDGLVNAYNWALTNNSAHITVWDVYGNNLKAQGKPVTPDMEGYDLVIWIPTRDMYGPVGPGDAFNSADETEVSGYLGTGGSFFLSNIYWSDFTAGAGVYGSGNFAYDVFGIGSMTSQWSGYEDYVQGYAGDAIFGNFGPAWQDWNRFNWGGVNPAASDIISPFSSISDIESYQSTPLSSGTGGVHWNQGSFKSMFMGFPFETLQYPESDDFWARALEWFVPGSTSYNPELFTYRDAWWVCGDNSGGPSTVYKVVPGQALALQVPEQAISYSFRSIAADGNGNPLAAGPGLVDMWYYYEKSWHPVNNSGASLASYTFEGIDFNPNEGRFYAVGNSSASVYKKIFYTDKVPLDSSTSYCHEYISSSFTFSGILYKIAWNNLHDYGLAVGTNEIIKVWPYSYYNNGTMKWDLVNSSADTYYDVSWDSDGWNEAGIVGSQSPSLDGMYWRYYDSNPILIEGLDSNSGLPYYACAMKPPSSPKWLFIPQFNGGWQVNILLKDQSKTLTLNADYPHIFTLDVWKQNDLLQGTLLNTQLDADSIYTFFIEGNYTKGGIDQWLNLQVNLTAWYDNGFTGVNSNPGDPTWALDNYRTRQFNLTYVPSTTTATMNFPVPGLAPPEFSVYDVWEDPVLYGTDSSHHKVYINVTFGTQTYVAGSAFANGAANLGRIYDVNSALNDANSWDYNVTMYDTTTPNAQNTSFEEFGIKKYASVSVSGNPAGSAPPGAVNYMLTTPSQIHYSSNSDYYVNISIPNLYKNGVLGPDFIPASNVAVQNTHSRATNINSDISLQINFIAPNTDYCVWGTPGIPLQQVLNGTESAGPEYSDFSTGPGVFEVTEVYWWVSVPAGLPEGVYWATITVTIWN